MKMSFIEEDHVDASKMLAAALEQMDNIIAATALDLQNGMVDYVQPPSLQHSKQASTETTFSSNSNGAFGHSLSSEPSSEKISINKSLECLRNAIQSKTDNHNVISDELVDLTDAQVILEWLQSVVNSNEDEKDKNFIKGLMLDDTRYRVSLRYHETSDCLPLNQGGYSGPEIVGRHIM